MTDYLKRDLRISRNPIVELKAIPTDTISAVKFGAKAAGGIVFAKGLTALFVKPKVFNGVSETGAETGTKVSLEERHPIISSIIKVAVPLTAAVILDNCESLDNHKEFVVGVASDSLVEGVAMALKVVKLNKVAETLQIGTIYTPTGQVYNALPASSSIPKQTVGSLVNTDVFPQRNIVAESPNSSLGQIPGTGFYEEEDNRFETFYG